MALYGSLGLLREEVDSEVEDSVVAEESGLRVEVDGATFGRRNSKFGSFAVGVENRSR